MHATLFRPNFDLRLQDTLRELPSLYEDHDDWSVVDLSPYKHLVGQDEDTWPDLGRMGDGGRKA